MTNVLALVAGLLLIGFGSVIMIYALPSLSTATTTGVGTPYENATSFTVAAVRTTNQIVIVLPGVLFLVGIGMVFLGVKD